MKIIKVGLALILALYLSRYFGTLILTGNLMKSLLLFLVGILFIVSSIKYKFALFTIVTLVPFSFHQKLSGVELLAPLLCFLLLMELLVNKKKLLSKKASIWLVAIGIISIWALINYSRNPVVGMLVGGSGLKQTGIRSYFQVFVGITVFFSSYWVIQYRNIDVKKLFLFLIAVTLILALLKTISYLSGGQIPLLDFFFKFSTISKTKSFFRIQGLSKMVIIGIPLLLSMSYIYKFSMLRILMFLIFFILLVLSGARTMFAGTVMSIFIFIVCIRKKNLIPLLALLALVVSIYILIIPQIELPGHLERMTKVQEAIEHGDEYRASAFEAYWDEFMKNPLFGKGVGFAGTELDFVSGNLTHGGHGAYLSVMAIYGIGGVIYFFLMVFGSFYYSYKLFRLYMNHNDYALWTLFAFLYLVIRIPNFLAAGNGISEYDIWYIAGIIAGIRSLHYNDIINIDGRVNTTG